MNNINKPAKRQVEVVIDDKSGFCAGVVRAIKMAENAATDCKEQTVVSIGDIVHNANEVKRLEALGLNVAQSLDSLFNDNLPNPIALIRAHGEPPATFETLKNKGISIIDATCPVVSKLQERVKENWLKMNEVGGTVIIFGKRGHAEVVGLVGQTVTLNSDNPHLQKVGSSSEAVVVESEADLVNVDFTRPIVMLSQTTQSLLKFEQIKAIILERAQSSVEVIDTICRAVANRGDALGQFARNADLVLFVSGRKSSNGRALYEICRSANPNSHFIESEQEILSEWLLPADIRRVGVCGATSTPRWQMDSVARCVGEIVSSFS